MPGGAWRHFCRQFSKIWRHFWQKMNALEISSPEPVTLIRKRDLPEYSKTTFEIVNFARQAPL